VPRGAVDIVGDQTDGRMLALADEVGRCAASLFGGRRWACAIGRPVVTRSATSARWISRAVPSHST
jgi:hypothetical protein